MTPPKTRAGKKHGVILVDGDPKLYQPPKKKGATTLKQLRALYRKLRCLELLEKLVNKAI